ncbi:acyltransferase family protein [Rhizobium leguminosarum]|uniref:acyltransferase family protein n=1 Tax=Rhizobium leguminosarum TaxID=384 RepID=UPI0004816C3D|nr:acyltransferase family protein [Rhizobium leguminosarum]
MLQRQLGSDAAERAYRPDINALRAVAVASVVLFHFGVPGFKGGFVGVDVFFVISGFLMTAIITRRLSSGRFNLIEFYLDRGRRIVPALAVMIMTILVLGWQALPTLEFRQLATEAKLALLFLSNELFLSQAGYFDKESTSKWLLHTWSLSVEWQFYVLYPLILWGAWSVTPRRGMITAVVATIFALSVGWLLLPHANSSLAFYSLTTRAWEMATGGLVCLFSHRFRPSRSAQIAGIVLVSLSVVIIKDGLAWPGLATFFPVLGAALVIAAGDNRSLPRALACASPIGAASYSIYLWHWPITVGLHYFMIDKSPAVISAGILSSLVLGAISYQVIERPTMALLRPSGTIVNIAAISVAVLAGTYLAGSTYRSSVNRPIPAGVKQAEEAAYDFNPRRDDCLLFKGLEMPRCRYGDANGKLQAIVYGDSHADAIVTAVAAVQPSGGYVEEWSYASCPTIFEVNLVINDRPCPQFNEWARERMKTLPPGIPIVIVNRFASYPLGDEGLDRPYIYFSRMVSTPDPDFISEYQRHLVATMCEIAAERPVYLLRPVPEMPYSVPSFLARSAMLSNVVSAGIKRAAYNERTKIVDEAQDIASSQCGVNILDTSRYLCTASTCAANDGVAAFYFDNSHLSEAGNRKLVPMFAQVFKRPATQP